MARARRLDVRQPQRNTVAYDPDIPTPGFYRYRLRHGGMPVAVHVFLGPIVDPDTGEAMLDRGHAWQATVNGRPVDLYSVWPRCAREPINEREAAYLTELQRWGERNDPDGFHANPHKKIDLLQAPLPW